MSEPIAGIDAESLGAMSYALMAMAALLLTELADKRKNDVWVSDLKSAIYREIEQNVSVQPDVRNRRTMLEASIATVQLLFEDAYRDN